jgi:hypothetical protein
MRALLMLALFFRACSSCRRNRLLRMAGPARAYARDRLINALARAPALKMLKGPPQLAASFISLPRYDSGESVDSLKLETHG